MIGLYFDLKDHTSIHLLFICRLVQIRVIAVLESIPAVIRCEAGIHAWQVDLKDHFVHIRSVYFMRLCVSECGQVCICAFVCVFQCVSEYLSVQDSECVFIWISVCVSVYQSACFSVFISVCFRICFSMFHMRVFLCYSIHFGVCIRVLSVFIILFQCEFQFFYQNVLVCVFSVFQRASVCISVHIQVYVIATSSYI